MENLRQLHDMSRGCEVLHHFEVVNCTVWHANQNFLDRKICRYLSVSCTVRTVPVHPHSTNGARTCEDWTVLLPTSVAFHTPDTVKTWPCSFCGI